MKTNTKHKISIALHTMFALVYLVASILFIINLKDNKELSPLFLEAIAGIHLSLTISLEMVMRSWTKVVKVSKEQKVKEAKTKDDFKEKFKLFSKDTDLNRKISNLRNLKNQNLENKNRVKQINKILIDLI